MLTRRRSSAVRSSVSLLSAVIVLSSVSGSPSSAQEPAPVRPGPEHALLASLAGTWDAKAHFRMMPGEPTQSSEATETRRMGCGGLWLIGDYRGQLAGLPFEGHSTIGYDQSQKKFVGHWVDSLSSSLSVLSGVYDEKTRTFTYESTTIEPGSGEKMVFTLKQTIEDEDHHVDSIIVKGPDGKEFESLRVEYTRKGASLRTRADPLAAVVGTWTMQVSYDENAEPIDYELRLAKAGDGLAAVLVSPRSGEHKFKSAEWKQGTLHLAITRSYDGNEIELKYEAKASGKGLSGSVTMVGAEGFSGTWTATRKK